MSPLKQSNNIAARMGRWSASHWKTATFGWLAFVIVSFAIGIVAPMQMIRSEAWFPLLGRASPSRVIVWQRGPASYVVVLPAQQASIDEQGRAIQAVDHDRPAAL